MSKLLFDEVVVATGDNGAGCHLQKYETNYPASSPYVLATGGTWIPPVTSTYEIEGMIIVIHIV